MAFNKSHKVPVLEIPELGPNGSGDRSGEELSHVRVNAFQPNVRNFCRVI